MVQRLSHQLRCPCLRLTPTSNQFSVHPRKQQNEPSDWGSATHNGGMISYLNFSGYLKMRALSLCFSNTFVKNIYIYLVVLPLWKDISVSILHTKSLIQMSFLPNLLFLPQLYPFNAKATLLVGKHFMPILLFFSLLGKCPVFPYTQNFSL